MPIEEWPKLAETEAATIWPQMDPLFTDVIVVERDGVIVGSVLLMSVIHAECVTNKGGTGVARKLVTAMRQHLAETRGAGGVWGAAVDQPMRELLEKHGSRVPGDHFILKMWDTCRQQ